MAGRHLLFVLAQLAVLVAAVPASLRAAPPTTSPADQLQLFSDYPHQIQLSYPADWKRELNPPVRQAIFIIRMSAVQDGKFNDHVSLIQTQAQKGAPLKALTNELLNEDARSAVNFEMGEESDFDWNGIPARRATFSKTLLVWPIKTLWVIAVREDKLLLLAYNANAATFDEHLPQVEKLLKSVQWEAPEPAADSRSATASPSVSNPPRLPAALPAATRPASRLLSRPATRPLADVQPPKPIAKSLARDPVARISFEVPSNCVQMSPPSPQEGVLSAHDYQLQGPDGRPRAIVQIVAHKTGPNDRLSTEAVKKAYLDGLREQGTDIKVVPDAKPAPVGPRLAQVVRATYTTNQQQRKQALYFTSSAGIGYAFILTAPAQSFDEVEPAFLDILKSVRWTQ